IAQWENAHVLSGIEAAVVEIPDFRALIFRIPLAEAVAVAEEAFLRAGFFFVAAGATDAAVETEFFDRSQEHGNLQSVAADFAGSRLHGAVGNGVLHL